MADTMLAALICLLCSPYTEKLLGWSVQALCDDPVLGPSLRVDWCQQHGWCLHKLVGDDGEERSHG